MVEPLKYFSSQAFSRYWNKCASHYPPSRPLYSSTVRTSNNNNIAILRWCHLENKWPWSEMRHLPLNTRDLLSTKCRIGVTRKWFYRNVQIYMSEGQHSFFNKYCVTIFFEPPRMYWRDAFSPRGNTARQLKTNNWKYIELLTQKCHDRSPLPRATCVRRRDPLCLLFSACHVPPRTVLSNFNGSFTSKVVISQVNMILLKQIW